MKNLSYPQQQKAKELEDSIRKLLFNFYTGTGLILSKIDLVYYKTLNKKGGLNKWLSYIEVKLKL